VEGLPAHFIKKPGVYNVMFLPIGLESGFRRLIEEFEAKSSDCSQHDIEFPGEVSTLA